MTELLTVNQVSKRFRDRSGHFDAVQSVSLHLAPGEALGIVGESGSGKSTLLKLIAGLQTPDSGEILLNGQPLGKKRTRDQFRQMQMIFQNASGSFNPRIRLNKSVLESARNLHVDLQEDQIGNLFQAVGLQPEIGERYPAGISGGQCQRLAIARAIAVKPDLLLCDEITSALDVSAQAQILRLLARLRQENHTALLFISHDLSVVRSLCDRILVMRSGQVVEEGSAQQILEDPREDYTKLLISSIMHI